MPAAPFAHSTSTPRGQGWRDKLRSTTTHHVFNTQITGTSPIGSGNVPGEWHIRPTQASDSNLERRFNQTVRPFLNTYCMGCHGTSTPAAQFDMRRYSSMAQVVDDFGHWILMGEKLAAGQMPPRSATQPAAGARQEMIDWIRNVRVQEARKNAGDPGLVPARRLSNAEYDNTIRDLTGIDIRPAREFPIDPANAAGFDHSGESLASRLSYFLWASMPDDELLKEAQSGRLQRGEVRQGRDHIRSGIGEPSGTGNRATKPRAGM